jgi:cytochrome c553
MTRISYVVLLWLLAVPVGAAPPSAISEPPGWAYPVTPPDFKPAPDDGTIRKVPDSGAGYTLTQLRDRFLAPDWHPEDHPKMPAFVAHGRKPDVLACGFCHRADGPGGPENASLAGLPYAYIVQQMSDYKSGRRSTALPNRAPQALMMALAKAAKEYEIREAARYFSSLKPRKNIRVVETDRVPKTYVANWFLAVQEGKESEPLGERIVETPEDLERFENRDARATFVAYVPTGSIRKGAAIASGEGTEKALACTTCHGKDLRGQAAVPSIAGRSPSYVVRQLYEMQTGARAGKGAGPMKKPVARLNLNDMISVAAYLASLKP